MSLTKESFRHITSCWAMEGGVKVRIEEKGPLKRIVIETEAGEISATLESFRQEMVSRAIWYDNARIKHLEDHLNEFCKCPSHGPSLIHIPDNEFGD